MRVMVLGAAGFIGIPLVRALERRGAEAVAVSRTGAGPGGVAADRRDPAAIRALARGRGVGAIIDLLAYTEADTVPLLAALDGEVGRWVMASSCDVYRNYAGLHRKAEVAPVLGLLGEHSPLRATRYPYRADPRRPADAPDAWLDDYDKIPLEAALRARPSLNGAILRLPMVFGPGDRQRRFRWLARPMAKGVAQLKVDPDWLAWRATYGYVADVADAIACAALDRRAIGRTFNLGAPAVDHAAWLRRFAEAIGWGGEVVPEPHGPASRLTALDLRFPLAIDTSAFRQTCGWSESTPMGVALARTTADEIARG